MSRQQTAKLVLTAVSAMVGVTVTGGAAQAQAQSGSLRMAEHQNLAGDQYVYVVSNPNLGGPGDDASSVRNESDSAWVLYDDKSYQDRRYCIRPGEYVANLHDPQWSFGDKISSVKRLAGNSCSGFPTFF